MSCFQELNSILQQGQKLVHSLSLLLTQQHQLLKSRQHEALNDLLDPQQQLLSQISHVENVLQALLQQHQLPMNRYGIQQLILRCAPNEQSLLNQSWQQFAEPLSSCRQQIKVQERVLYRNRQSVQMLLSLLKGQIKSQPGVYKANGQTCELMLTNVSAYA